LSGEDATIFAYGQTGSGKTHTMLGATPKAAFRVRQGAPATALLARREFETDAASAAGIVPRAMADVLAALRARSAAPHAPLASSSLFLSVVEVQGENVTDLLSAGAPVGPWRAAAAAAVAAGAVAVALSSPAEACALLERAESLKRRAATALNDQSSRAHTLYVLDLVQTSRGGAQRRSRLSLADLGGSELVSLSGALASNERLKEAIAINKSLLALKQCISARARGAKAPFLDSRLTQLLSVSLSGENATRVAVLVSARSDPRHVVETLQSLRFGEDAAAGLREHSIAGVGGAAATAAAAKGFGFGAGGARGTLDAIAARLKALEAQIAQGERWERGRPVGVEGLREEYEALLQTQAALVC
jgi:hypothetical protein